MEAIDLSRATWRKSSRSSANSACVEVAFTGGLVALRDSKNPGGSHLVVTAHGWRQFVTGVAEAAPSGP